jgi:hypothetical protein
LFPNEWNLRDLITIKLNAQGGNRNREDWQRTNRVAYDELLIGFRDPINLLEMRDALPPGAGHLRDVGAPE